MSLSKRYRCLKPRRARQLRSHRPFQFMCWSEDRLIEFEVGSGIQESRVEEEEDCSGPHLDGGVP